MAVKVTDRVRSDGLTDEFNDVFVAAWLFVRVNDAEVVLRLMVAVTL